MHHILVIGAGKIGSLITFLLTHSNNYFVYLADIQEDVPQIRKLGNMPNFKYVQLDAKDTNAISQFLQKNKIEAVVSSLPFYCNVPIATVAASNHVHYFDLTEDVETTAAVLALSKTAKGSFVPQCGL